MEEQKKPESTPAAPTPTPYSFAKPASVPSPTPAPNAKPLTLKEQIIEVFKKTYDPEIPVNIYELGMIYHCEVDDKGNVAVKMTLTTPACPVAGSLPPHVESQIRALSGVSSVRLDLVWEPAWTPAMMSESAKLTLGMT